MHLQILSWNCQSLSNKLFELNNFINNPNFPTPHVILLQETWLNNKQTINIKNYKTVRKDRNSQSRYPHGGVAIFVHQNIEFKSVKFVNLKHIEGVFISVDTGSFPIVIGSIYSSSSLSRDEAKCDIRNLLSQKGPFLIAGDWNAKHQEWNNFKQNLKGLKI